MKGFFAILSKEVLHILRQRTTIFFAIVVPALQLIIFGFAANLQIEDIPVVVLDLDGRRESRELISAVEATQVFSVVSRVTSEEEFRRAITGGHAKMGILIPPDYSNRLLRREQALVQALVDGSDSQVATAAANAMGLLATNLAIRRARALGEALGIGLSRNQTGDVALPIEVRTRILFNPDLEDSHFFVPGLVAIILQFVLSFLTSFSIVGERENGTLEQLFVTPVSPAGLLFGKLAPYAILAVVELLIILILMVELFGVPVHGSLLLLYFTSLLFMITVLGLGLLISTLARTQLQAMQASFLFMLPSVLLSGFVFPRSEMPLPLYALSHALPVTYFLEILRGVILRGSDLADVRQWVAGLIVCTVVILTLATLRFRKQLD